MEQTIVEFDELIKGQVDSIEVLWGLKGYNGRIALEYLKNRKITMWSISKKSDIEEYPEFYHPMFKIIISNKEEYDSFARVETDLTRLGYSTFRHILNVIPDFFSKRAKLGLEYVQMDSDWFEFKTKEDLIDLFKLIENSPRLQDF